jgi:predicted aspartyl protease
MRHLLILPILLVAFPLAAAANQPTLPGAVRFDDGGDGAIVVPVWIGSSGPFRFLLDTGSNISAISDAIAQRMVLRPVAQTSLLTAGGEAVRLIVRVSAVSLAGVMRENVLASLASRDDLAMLGGKIDGVLGIDFLGSDNFTIDYRRHLFTWDAAEARTVGAVVRVPLVTRNGRFVAALPQPNASVLDLVPDTGSSGVVLFDRKGIDAPRLWTDTTVTIAGLTGSREARATRLSRLSIGSLTLRDVPVIVIARDEEEDSSDGLLPLHGFSRVSFRPGEGSLLLER